MSSPIRIGINGFGRIGRNYLRASLTGDSNITVVAVNDLSDAKTLATLYEWDSIFGHTDNVHYSQDSLLIDEKQIAVFNEKEPEKIPWSDAEVDVVIEATGRFTSEQDAQNHIGGSVKKVIVSAPASGHVQTIILGVNQDSLSVGDYDVFSNGSCTTNSLAPLAKVLHNEFGIVSGLMTTVHAYTSDQRLHDSPHRDLRRARAATQSIVPTSSGAAKAIGLVLPELDGTLTGAALRVPVIDGSITDLSVVVEKTVSVDDINAAFRVVSRGELSGILQYSEAPLVSTDIIGNPHSCIFDAPLTKSIGNHIKVSGWYDNEWGFSNRLVELSALIGSQL